MLSSIPNLARKTLSAINTAKDRYAAVNKAHKNRVIIFDLATLLAGAPLFEVFLVKEDRRKRSFHLKCTSGEQLFTFDPSSLVWIKKANGKEVALDETDGVLADIITQRLMDCHEFRMVVQLS